jgi:hypothetical protein
MNSVNCREGSQQSAKAERGPSKRSLLTSGSLTKEVTSIEEGVSHLVFLMSFQPMKRTTYKAGAKLQTGMSALARRTRVRE